MKLKNWILVFPAVMLIATAAHAQKITTWTTDVNGNRSTTSSQETTVVPAKVVPLEPAGAPVTTTTTTTTTTSFFSFSEGELYRANEFSFDAFGTYTTTHRDKFADLFTHNLRHGDWGGGVGVNYFFCKYVGIGADVIMPANGGQFVDSASGNLILRLPIDVAHTAPYIFGGGGGQFDPESQWLADFGVGVDFRFNAHMGLFTDARYNWLDKSGDYGLFRAGLRFAF